jgi:regulator of CtrA degradation
MRAARRLQSLRVMTTPQDHSHIDAAPQSLVAFARSAVFERTYREGMTLVEDMAAYLDGPGRSEARTLPRMAALAYAGETMRLTTRLMQVASWLMVHRAVRDGELTPENAREEKYRLVDRPSMKAETFVAQAADLPAALRALGARADALYDRVVRLDAGFEAALSPGGLAGQLARLKAAFGE